MGEGKVRACLETPVLERPDGNVTLKFAGLPTDLTANAKLWRNATNGTGEIVNERKISADAAATLNTIR